MNSFETLPDDAMLHIFSFLPGKDLLTLSTMDRKFHRVITTSKQTKDKTPMLINCKHKGLKLADAIKAARSRGFTALKLGGVSEYKSKTLLFNKMMRQLSGTVQDLVIENSNFKEDQFQLIIQMFLPKLTKCKLDNIKYKESEEIAEVSSGSGSNHPLEVLEIIGTDDKVFDFFAHCSGLKSFSYEHLNENNQRLNDFVARQTRLEKLSCNYDLLDLGRMNFDQLKVLKTQFEDNVKADGLGKLPSLKMLNVTASASNLRRVIESSCSALNLEDLRIQTTRYEYLQLDGILNHNVRKLTIYDRIIVTKQLLDVFSGVESICLYRNENPSLLPLDLSYFPLETIKKIEILEGFPTIRFSPMRVPFNFAIFESKVNYFVDKNAGRITSIKIGHENWRNKEDFSLPNSFCEALVQSLPKLEHLELYNVAHRGDFIRFLEANQRNLRFAKIIKPLVAGGPVPNEFRLEM